MKYSVPNWAQALIARAVGLEPEKCGVQFEDERSIVFLQYLPRQEFAVCKRTGEVDAKKMDAYAAKRTGLKKASPTKAEGFCEAGDVTPTDQSVVTY